MCRKRNTESSKGGAPNEKLMLTHTLELGGYAALDSSALLSVTRATLSVSGVSARARSRLHLPHRLVGSGAVTQCFQSNCFYVSASEVKKDFLNQHLAIFSYTNIVYNCKQTVHLNIY